MGAWITPILLALALWAPGALGELPAQAASAWTAFETSRGPSQPEAVEHMGQVALDLLAEGHRKAFEGILSRAEAHLSSSDPDVRGGAAALLGEILPSAGPYQRQLVRSLEKALETEIDRGRRHEDDIYVTMMIRHSLREVAPQSPVRCPFAALAR